MWATFVVPTLSCYGGLAFGLVAAQREAQVWAALSFNFLQALLGFLVTATNSLKSLFTGSFFDD